MHAQGGRKKKWTRQTSNSWMLLAPWALCRRWWSSLMSDTPTTQYLRFFANTCPWYWRWCCSSVPYVLHANWNLHLQALELFTKYFFAHDRLNYARMIPVYLAEMKSLQKGDTDIYSELLDGNWIVNKNSNVSFCGLGADNGLEHVNRSMKVIGGLVGITLDPWLPQNFPDWRGKLKKWQGSRWGNKIGIIISPPRYYLARRQTSANCRLQWSVLPTPLISLGMSCSILSPT